MVAAKEYVVVVLNVSVSVRVQGLMHARLRRSGGDELAVSRLPLCAVGRAVHPRTVASAVRGCRGRKTRDEAYQQVHGHATGVSLDVEKKPRQCDYVSIPSQHRR